MEAARRVEAVFLHVPFQKRKAVLGTARSTGGEGP
jgi:hypothetical protein